eukprot:403372827
MTLLSQLNLAKLSQFNLSKESEEPRELTKYHYLSILLLSTLILAVVIKLKQRFYEHSTGQYVTRERKVQFAQPITREKFNEQSKKFTLQEVDKLLHSQEYKQKMPILSRYRNNHNFTNQDVVMNQSSNTMRNYDLRGGLGSKSFDASHFSELNKSYNASKTQNGQTYGGSRTTKNRYANEDKDD